MNFMRFVIFLVLIGMYSGLQAQDSQIQPKRPRRPNIPGSFLVDFGVNIPMNKPEKGFKKGFFGSRSINLYYYYPARLGKSKFSFNPGFGLSAERFKWTNSHILMDTSSNEEMYSLVPNSIYSGLRKSQLIMNYMEVPLEFRFEGNPDDPSRTFWVSFGGRAGMLVGPHTKVKYKEDGEMKILKDKSRHGLNQFRYAAALRFGVAGFGWFAYYNLTPLFQKNKGPSKTDMTVFTVGITINGL